MVLVEFPLVVNPLKLALGGKSFIESYRWRPERGTKLTVVDKRSGEVTRGECEPMFAFRHVNAFERDTELIVDLVAYDDASIIDRLSRSSCLASTTAGETPASTASCTPPAPGTGAFSTSS